MLPGSNLKPLFPNKEVPALTLQALKGFKDILPDEIRLWQQLEATARHVFERYGFSEIRVPILEKTELFARSIGEATDIVEKEMYTFSDRNGESVTMRPEGTASVLRAFIEHSLHTRQPVQRLYTIGPMFRHERPQKGRLRQFHQMSVEVLGSVNPRTDIEVMAMAWLLLKELGLAIRLEINSLGCRECRPAYKEALVTFLEARQGQVCTDCERRRSTNPLRVLDCKSENCQAQYSEAPSILDHLCAACQEHFKAVNHGLAGLGIEYAVNSRMVRGLDYYTRTAFEFITTDLGAQSAVGAGGRYDGLLNTLGGPDLPGIGFALGMERLTLLLARQASALPKQTTDLFIAAIGEAALEPGFLLAQGLRTMKYAIALDHEGKSLKSQMKQADRVNARYVFILGQEELQKGEGILRNMTTREQEVISLAGPVQTWATTIAARITP